MVRKTHRFLAFIACLLVSTTAYAQRYFPLDEGDKWTYTGDTFGDTWVYSVVAIDDEGVVTFSRRGPEVEIRFQEDGSAISVQLEDDSFGLFYDFELDTWRHRSVITCSDSRTVMVGSRTETVETPAGTFEDCVRLDYGPTQCADAGVVSEWFAPDVGLVKWVELNLIGSVTYTLTALGDPPEKPFTRGDVNEDGQENISDGVGILRFLFAGTVALSCEQSADVDDDESVRLNDAVFLLTFLFRHGEEPPPPHAECADDPTDGTVTCESYAPCE